MKELGIQMITDTDPNRNREYHKAGDTADRLGRMAMVVQGVYAAVLNAASKPSQELAMSKSQDYFSTDYFTARTRFRQAVEKAGGRLESLPLDAKGPGNEDLGIDIGWFGPENPRRVLLHSSGLHGVEGFAGSAVQLQLLDDLPQLPADTALVLVHVLNPYGMAWFRRVNENNVDLNRNFLGDAEYSGAPEAYPNLDAFLSPQSPPSWDAFYLKAGWLILRYGFPALKQAVAGGQYEYPKGLFFGGKHLQQGPEKYQAFLAERLGAADQVVVIDVHTGLGKYGEDALLVEKKEYKTLRQIFGERVTPSEPEESPAYRVRGGIDSMIPRVLGKAHVSCLCQEFGTYSSTEVLYALREENRWHHYGDGTIDHLTRRELKRAFCPDDRAWQNAVLFRGKELVQEAVEFLSKP
jgi:hypothetical protein